jgi:hypothetical protein
MGTAGNDVDESCTAALCDSKMAQERAQTGRQFFGAPIAAMARAFQKRSCE